MKEALVEEAVDVDGEQVEVKAPDNVNERKINTEVSSISGHFSPSAFPWVSVVFLTK